MLKKILLFLVLGVVAFVSWFAWAIFTDKPPHFFPLDNAEGEYKVTKKCPGGQGWTENTPGEDKAYSVEYKGSNIFMSEEQGNSNFFRICVGRSKIDLEPLAGKNVKNIKGTYVTSNKQCINGNCIDIGGPYVVLNIDKLEVAE